MRLAETINDVRHEMQPWRRQNFRIAFVPTMGNLHAGHLSLVDKAREVADKVVVSIYVNPTQFGAGEDFDAYPRTFEADRKALVQAGVDLLFLPSNETMYPHTDLKAKRATTEVYVPGISEILCGEHRPGHFLGVSTVVSKLFNIVQPDVAVFGQKDFQQVAVIRRMVADLFMPVEIVALPTKREADGLAMSSRNQYLSAENRKKAAQVYQLMKEMIAAIKGGGNIAETEIKASEILLGNGFTPEYFSFRDPLSLKPLDSPQPEMVLLVAVKLGSTRLIDNCLFSLA